LSCSSSPSLYLFDWSLPLFCPDLNAELTVPEYFSRDFLKMTSDHALYRNSWPSLFVAPDNKVGFLLDKL
jgi:histone arginine demethylase JMJD6